MSDPTTAPADATLPPADNSTAPANSTANSTAPADASTGTPMAFWLWGILSSWLAASATLTYAQYYTTYTDLLYNNKGTNTNTGWTKSHIQGTNPVRMWIYSSYAGMGLQSFASFFWLLGIIGQKSLFLKVAGMSMLFPVIELGMWSYTYWTYTACSAVTNTAQFDGTTTTVTQLSSCSGAATSDTSYGTSGSVAAYVSSDQRDTWYWTNAGSDVAMIAVAMMAQSKFKAAFGAAPAAAADADADATAPADDATAAAPADDAAATPAPTDDSSSTPASTTDPSTSSGSTDPAPATGTTDPAPADTTDKGPGDGGNNNNQGFGSGADWNEPSNQPDPEPTEPKQQCGYWGCL